MQATAGRRVVVVGAGIVGMASALWLQRDGHRVTVIDPREPGDGSSFGNAGSIVLSSCVPVAMPGIWKHVPDMLLNPTGPLVIRWRYLPRLTPWLLSFLASSAFERADAIAAALSSLLSGAGDAWRELARQCGAGDLLRAVGWLEVCESDAVFAASEANRQMMERHGCPFQVLDASAVRQLEPNLAPTVRHGVFHESSLFVRNPKRMVVSFAREFVNGGGELLRKSVSGFDMSTGARRVLTDAGSHETDAVVVAAGAWSARFSAMLGSRVLLDTERGYHLMLPSPASGIARPVLSRDHGFVLCPMEEGLRLTSGIELASVDAPADYRRIRRVLPLARRLLPSLEGEPFSEWMGRRPSMPDSMPILARSPHHADVIFAFGHGHIGMTLGPLTGRLVADLVARRQPAIDLTPFAVR